MKVIGISTSPRLNSNSDLLLRKALAGAGSTGAQAEYLQLYKMNIKPCNACGACYGTGECIIDDDFNVVFHEFAHQLDLENGEIDGIPRLESKDHYASWTRTLSDALELFRKDVRRRKQTAIDPYAAEDLSEFFAVSVESFFEQPLRLKKSYPALYRELCDYFRQDPAAWFQNLR